MLWKEVKSWAKNYGYDSLREKSQIEDNPNPYDYYWSKQDNPEVTGVAFSVSTLAADIFNHMTNNQWLDHQQQYQKDLELKDEIF